MFKYRWPYIVVIGIVVIVGWWWSCGSHTTVLLVRHADRVSGQDALNPDGAARAQELVHVAEKAGVAAIITSDANRAVLTAQPLATSAGLTPVVIPANDIQSFVDEIRSRRGTTLLVVGHSNTVPQIIAELGGPALPNIDDLEFDNVFVLTLCRCSWRGPKLVNLQYGVTSP